MHSARGSERKEVFKPLKIIEEALKGPWMNFKNNHNPQEEGTNSSMPNSWKKQILNRTKTIIRDLKFIFIVDLITAGVLIGFLYLFISYVIPFPSTLSHNTAMDILKTICQVGGVLIGFFGTVTMQLISYFKGQIREQLLVSYDSTISIAIIFYSLLLSLSNMAIIDEPVNRISITEPIFWLLSGILSFSMVVVGLIFLKYWKKK